MKVTNSFSVVILTIRKVAKLSTPNSGYVDYMYKNAYFGGCTIYDCNFRQAVNLLKRLKTEGYNTFIHRE